MRGLSLKAAFATALVAAVISLPSGLSRAEGNSGMIGCLNELQAARTMYNDRRSNLPAAQRGAVADRLSIAESHCRSEQYPNSAQQAELNEIREQLSQVPPTGSTDRPREQWR